MIETTTTDTQLAFRLDFDWTILIAEDDLV